MDDFYSRIDEPEPYYLAHDCFAISESVIEGNYRFTALSVTRPVRFHEDLPVLIRTPLLLGMVKPTFIGFTRQQDDDSFLGDDVLI